MSPEVQAMPTAEAWTEEDTARAQGFWREYQQAHDVSDRLGQTAGIDPKTGRVWFGKSALDIVEQLDAQNARRLLYFVTVGLDYYRRKG
jgi:hypothetical protein